jgi:hypothetical protein
MSSDVLVYHLMMQKSNFLNHQCLRAFVGKPEFVAPRTQSAGVPQENRAKHANSADLILLILNGSKPVETEDQPLGLFQVP